MAVLDKHAAVSGVAIVGSRIGAATGPSALVAEWAQGKIVRVALEHPGAAWSATVTTFLSGLQKPVPIVVGPDGAVFVADWATGFVYRIAVA